MFRASDFHAIVSGRQCGLRAGALRCALATVEPFYKAAVRWRNHRYDRGATPVHWVDVPVVSVGNLTLGGTGKTPLVRWIARWFAQHEVPVAIISRGYGAMSGETNDEARELARSLPGVLHLQNPDRVAAARGAVESHQVRALVLDDAFQHRRIGRNLDIVLLDALEPFGFHHVFPRGLLREPVEGLRRAGLVILTRADHLDAAARAEVWKTVRRYAPEVVTAETMHAPQRLLAVSGATSPLTVLRDLPVAAFCGIGNPAGFRHTLEQCGCRLVGFREYPDHHAYDRQDLDSLAAWASESKASAVVCTCKDLAKLTVDRLGDSPLWGVEIELEFLTGREGLENCLQTVNENRKLRNSNKT